MEAEAAVAARTLALAQQHSRIAVAAHFAAALALAQARQVGKNEVLKCQVVKVK